MAAEDNTGDTLVKDVLSKLRREAALDNYADLPATTLLLFVQKLLEQEREAIAKHCEEVHANLGEVQRHNLLTLAENIRSRNKQELPNA